MRHLSVLVVSCLVGVTTGIVGFTFVYARGSSYLTDDPAACANCHIMSTQYAAWTKGSHRSVAACNDCHTPHNPVGKWATKAKNGFWHSFYFTSGTFAEPIRISKGSRAVAERTCRGCHSTIAHDIDPRGDGACTRCHQGVGHAD
jgi:cytochrome c nitrite reductase small subunit